jgi:preprotein translocase SecE subunit
VGPLFPDETRAKLKDVANSHPDLAAKDSEVGDILKKIDDVVKGLPTTPPEGAPPVTDWRDLLIAVRWIETPQSFAEGEVVSGGEFNAQADERRKQKKQFEDKNDPKYDPINASLIVVAEQEPVAPASGPVSPQHVQLLPVVQFTLPVLLSLLTLWFAWRIVNVPAFGDFLIATEAELNKVSWITRDRLYHDTVVVLITVLIMAVFLLAADFVWSKVLTGVGVLQPPPPETQTDKQQPW